MNKEELQRTEKAIVAIRDILMNEVIFPTAEEQSCLDNEMEDIFNALHKLKQSIITLEFNYGADLSTYGIASHFIAAYNINLGKM